MTTQNALSAPTSHRLPAAFPDPASWFIDLFGQLIKQGVKEALQECSTPVVAPVKALVGGPELAQEVTRLSKSRIYALVSQGLIPVIKAGNRLHFNRAELEQWVADGGAQQGGAKKAA